MTGRPLVRAVVRAALLSGVPSTAITLVRGEDVLASTRAAGAMVLGERAGSRSSLVAGGAAHLVLSAGWTVVIRRAVASAPSRVDRAYRGALVGAGIAVLDLGVIGRRFPAIGELDTVPQVADHLAFGALAAL
jgi:hypothetical protein